MPKKSATVAIAHEGTVAFKIMEGIKSRDDEAVRELLKTASLADLQAADEKGDTVLNAASNDDSYARVMMWLLDLRDAWSASELEACLAHANRWPRTELIAFLLRRELARRRRETVISKVSRLLGVKPKSKKTRHLGQPFHDGCLQTPMNIAAALGFQEIVEILVDEARFNPCPRGSHDQTALMMASNRAVIEVLLASGCDINAADKEGRTALHYASYHEANALPYISTNAEFMFANLIAREPRCVNCSRVKAIHDASLESLIDVARCLLENGADVSAIDNVGRSPLVVALAMNHDDASKIEAARLLLIWGANPGINGRLALESGPAVLALLHDAGVKYSGLVPGLRSLQSLSRIVVLQRLLPNDARRRKLALDFLENSLPPILFDYITLAEHKPTQFPVAHPFSPAEF